MLMSSSHARAPAKRIVSCGDGIVHLLCIGVEGRGDHVECKIIVKLVSKACDELRVDGERVDEVIDLQTVTLLDATISCLLTLIACTSHGVNAVTS